MGGVHSTTNSTSGPIPTPTTLSTPLGKLNGLIFHDESGRQVCSRYAKIPFALPPVGERRWRRPQKLSEDFSFNDPITGGPGDYTAFGPLCPQPDHLLNFDRAMVGSSACVVPPTQTPQQDEDCLYLSIWVPVGSQPPTTGWPVQIHLHGGWLQQGDACQAPYHDPVNVFSVYAEHPGRIIVAPTYRLGVFGFLAGEPLALAQSGGGRDEDALSNYGFWDQRAAIEWVAQHIGYFGGDRHSITVGGQSAGAYSAFYQLYHDTYLSGPERRLVRACYLWSNVPCVQPNGLTSPVSTAQFEKLCDVFDIDASLSPATKLARLRAASAVDMMAKIHELGNFTFRAVTDEAFIPGSLLSSLHSGEFTARLARNGTRLFLCDMAREDKFYGLVGKPLTSREGVVGALGAYYPPKAVEALVRLYGLARHDLATRNASHGADEEIEAIWPSLFGKIAAAAQVHAPVRGFAQALLSPRPGPSPTKPTATLTRMSIIPRENLFRCHIAWRAGCLDALVKPTWGACHVLDAPIWWASAVGVQGWTGEDMRRAQEVSGWFARFVAGIAVTTGGDGEQGRRRGADVYDLLIDEGGTVRYGVKDEMWEDGLKVWNALWEAQQVPSSSLSSSPG